MIAIGLIRRQVQLAQAACEPALDELSLVRSEYDAGVLADHMPDLKPIGDPERLKSGWLNGIKHWQVDYTGKCPVKH